MPDNLPEDPNQNNPVTPSPDDPLGLVPLFEGGGEPWLPLLKPTIEQLPGAASFIGPKRDPRIVPVRELTFQALKPNPPQKWNVVIFGQNPYPRVASATGIAMFDNTFNNWQDSQFGRVMSIRCIIKAACIWKHGIDRKTAIADIRKLLADNQTAQPPGWFQAMLAQGVLLLNAALTASSDGSLSTEQHTTFWRPVVEKLIEEIFNAKQNAPEKNRGVVFVWWGAHARALRSLVDQMRRKYPGVPVRHIDHCNPAAQGDIFCNGNHFADVNRALVSLGMDEIDWLPSVGWHAEPAQDQDTAQRMGDFITQTMELHRFYLERLQSIEDEARDLPAIVGVLETPVKSFHESVLPVLKLFPSLEGVVKHSLTFARQKVAKETAGTLTEDEVAAFYLYTTGSVFYRELNAALRDYDRSRATPYFAYLRLFFSAITKPQPRTERLWRGVGKDLRRQYTLGGLITWWGVSSCTSKLSVAQGFLGSRGKRMLFEIIPRTAIGIRSFSAFTGEEEFVLAPGTRLKVTDVKSERNGLCTVKLEELSEPRLVA
jgi:uracil DNA glycosylase